MNVVGNDVDDTEDIVYIACGLLSSIVKKFGTDVKYHSTMLYKDVGAWKRISKHIKKLNVGWDFYAY